MEASKAIERFDHWVRSTPGLEEIAASSDAVIAIAQHYGMPTSFLDFTTDPLVAGYFASVSDEPPDFGTESCIYCLDIKEADDIWRIIEKPSPVTERIVLDVPNLWRLEAQRGTFVYCPYEDLNGLFPIDRIVFPYQGAVSIPNDEAIYPRESRLEARLREYFQSEEIMKESVVFQEIRRHMPMMNIRFNGRPFIAEHFCMPLKPHPSWSSGQLQKWLAIDRVLWNDMQHAPDLTFSMNSSRAIVENVTEFKNFIASRIEKETSLRNSVVIWKVSVDRYDHQTVNRLNLMFQRIWNEMTGLPWADQDIVLSLSTALKYFLTDNLLREEKDLLGRELEMETARRILVRPVRIELGGQGNIHTFAWVDEEDLLRAVRPDFESLLLPKSRERILGKSFNTLMVARSPSLLFDFNKLSSLFAAQIIPTQVVFYPDHPLFPTPARLEVIGPE